MALSTWSDTRRLILLVVVIGVMAIGAISWIYSGDLTYEGQPPIRADGVGYYVYLPAVFLDHDLTMRKTAGRSFQADPTRIPGINMAHDNKGRQVPLDQFGIGEAVLTAPFFASGHALAVLTGADRDGFSSPYQDAVSAAALVYFLLGLVLTGLVLQRWFRSRTVLITVAAIAFGGAVFEYATYDASFSHAFAFFLVALVLWLTVIVWERPRAWTAAALGAAVGLVGLVRLTNLTVLIFVALIGIEGPAELRARAGALVRRIDLLAIGYCARVLVLALQFPYWHQITGEFFINPYKPTGVKLDLLHPHLIEVLFSVRKGLFFWTPLLILAVIGLPFLRRTAPALFLPALAYLAVVSWIVSSWTVWWYGASFGMRAMIDAMPAFALGLAALIEVAQTALARRTLAVAITATTLLAAHGMIAYWQRWIPFDGTTLSQYLDSFRHYQTLFG